MAAPLLATRRAPRLVLPRIASPSAAVTLALVVAYLGYEVAIALVGPTGPFLDESIYIAAGQRTLEGHGLTDYYLTWFAGSLLWPVLAGAANHVGDLAGARILAGACVAFAVWTVAQAAGHLFGPAVRPWTALVAVTNGAVAALGHLAVYDALSVAGVGVAFYGTTQLLRQDDRRWIVAAAAGLVVATLAKYPALFFAAPPLAGLVVLQRRRRAILDLGLLAFITAACLLCFFLQQRAQLASFAAFRTAQNPAFGATRGMIAFQLVYFSAVPMALAVSGWVLLRGRRIATLPLLGGLAMPALYHLGTGTSVGLEKHAVFGMLFALPLAGHGLARAWEIGPTRRTVMLLCFAGVAGFGAVQAVRLDRGWVDVRPSLAYLRAHVEPGQRLLIDGSWPYVQYLYPTHALASPFDVYDTYRVAHQPKPLDLCRFDWFVMSPGAASWPRAVQNAIWRCGSFRLVYAERDFRPISLGRDLRFFSYAATVAVYRNARP